MYTNLLVIFNFETKYFGNAHQSLGYVSKLSQNHKISILLGAFQFARLFQDRVENLCENGKPGEQHD
jgi:hypothetical protein